MSLMYSALLDVPLTTTLKKKLPKSVELPNEYSPLPHLKQLLQSAYDFKLERHIVAVAEAKRKEDEARLAAHEELRKLADKEKLEREKARLKAVAPGLSSEGEILQPIPVASSHARAASMSPELETKREVSPTLETLRPASDNKGGKPRNFNFSEFENGLSPANPWDSPRTSKDDLKILEDVLAGTVNQTPSHIVLDPSFDPLAPVANAKTKADTDNANQATAHNGLDITTPHDEISSGFITRSITDLSLNDNNHFNLQRSSTYSYGQSINSNESFSYRHPSQPHIAHTPPGTSFSTRNVKSYYGNNALPISSRESHSHSSVSHMPPHSSRFTTTPVAGPSNTSHPAPPQLPPKPAKRWYQSEVSTPPPIPPLPTSLRQEDQIEDETNIPQARELVNMGFSKEQALRALKAHDYDLIKATNYLLDSM